MKGISFFIEFECPQKEITMSMSTGSPINHVLFFYSYTLKQDDGESWGDKVNGSWTGLVGVLAQKVLLSII